jgi:DNA repair exonuclease SbcCD ATPase subunit
MLPSIVEATQITKASWDQIQVATRDLMDQLRNDILLDSFQYVDLHKLPPEKLVSSALKDLESTRKSFEKIAQQLGLPLEDINSRIEPLFTTLRELYPKVAPILLNKDRLKEMVDKPDSEMRQAFMTWLLNYPQLDHLSRIFSHVADYIKKSQSVQEPLERYLDILNNFLRDSNKKIQFDDAGFPVVSISGSGPRPITSLSSGETQIVVIIAHLCFNPAAQHMNAFIIDEPEISLHVRWQELFVESIQRANPRLQFILATHAPAIILDRIDKCIDLSK